MYRINLVLMVVLSLAVVGGSVLLSVNSETPRDEDREMVEGLLNRLCDSDPDISNEARQEIEKLGPKAIPQLRDAANSDDDLLAERADALLAKMTGGKIDPVANYDEDPEENESGTDTISRFHIQTTDTQVIAGEDLKFYVRFTNNGPIDVQLAWQDVRGLRSFAHFAWFEITDEEGNTTRVSADLGDKETDLSELSAEFNIVPRGDTWDLYAGQTDGVTVLSPALDKAGTYTVKFVYDAGQESAYRKALTESGVHAMPLSTVRHESNEVEITIVTAR